jgi:hypothetical protein
MGRTLLPFRPALEMELASWNEYRRGLRQEDRPSFDLLANCARKHADAGSLAARPLLSEVIFFSIALEHHKMIEELVKQNARLLDRIIALEQLIKKDLAREEAATK